MRKSAFAGLFACVAIFAASSSQVSAETLDPLTLNGTKLISTDKKLLTTSIIETIELKSRPPARPEAKIHIVGVNETLTSIAEQYKTPWMRLFNKNEQITHPNSLKPGDKVTVPLPDEQLKERPLPEPPVVQQSAPTAALAPRKASPKSNQAGSSATASRGSVAGNTYAPGYCTWYAKNMRPDMPNNLGNADTWVSRAAAQGMATGSEPRVGAIGQQGMHVVYVQSVNSDGTVTISEMNYRGLYVISSRTVPASTFRYVY